MPNFWPSSLHFPWDRQPSRGNGSNRIRLIRAGASASHGVATPRPIGSGRLKRLCADSGRMRALQWRTHGRCLSDV